MKMRLRTRGMLGVAALAVVGIAAQGVGVTAATWNDAEWDHGSVGTLSCEDAFSTRGAGRVLSGSALTLDLDDVVAASGVEVLHDGEQVSYTPSGANPVPGNDEAFADPLAVTLLQDALNLNLGSGMLKLPANNVTGAVGQYAEAHNNGTSRGASGYITSSGAISTDPGTSYPEFASVSLSGLLGALDPNLGEIVPGITDANLTIGAVAGRADLDECLHRWTNDLADSLIREYLVSSLHTTLKVEPLGDLVTAVDGIVTDLESAVNSLATSSSLKNLVNSGISPIIENLLGLGISLGSVRVESISATVDVTSLQDFISQPFGDDGGILEIRPDEGVVAVDIAALLGNAFPNDYSNGLNGLPPNTDLLSEPAVLTTLTAALSGALSDWIGGIGALLKQVVDAVRLDIKISVSLRIVLLIVPVHLADVVIDVGGPLGALEVADAKLENVLGGVLPGVTSLLNLIVNRLVGDLATSVVAVVLGAVTDTLDAVLVLVDGLTDLVAPIVTVVSDLYTALFLDGVVALRLNAQNHAANNTHGPPAWDGLPANQFDVAALHVSILESLGDSGINLYFARASVGGNCLRTTAAPDCR